MGTKSEMLANTIKQKFSGDVSMYKNTEIPKEISPDTLSETICSNWEDLNTDLIEEWIKDRKNIKNRIKIGVKISLTLIPDSVHSLEGWSLLMEIHGWMQKCCMNENNQKLFYEQFYKNNTFLLSGLYPDNEEILRSLEKLCDDIWIASAGTTGLAETALWVLSVKERISLYSFDSELKRYLPQKKAFDLVEIINKLQCCGNDYSKELKKAEKKCAELQEQIKEAHKKTEDIEKQYHDKAREIEKLKSDTEEEARRTDMLIKKVEILEKQLESANQDKYQLIGKLKVIPGIKLSEFINGISRQLSIYTDEINNIKEDSLSTEKEKRLKGNFEKIRSLLNKEGFKL